MKFLTKVIGLKCSYLEDYNDFNCANNLLAQIVEGKEYFMCVGQHGAIVKKVGDKYQYLELQTTNNNGFYDLTQSELRYRFGCKRSHTSHGWKMTSSGFLFEVDSFKGNEEMKEIFGYLNTQKDMQQKGVGGYAK